MFQTFSNAALTKAPFPDLAGAGSQFWGYVIHPFDLPWFHVTLGFGADRRILFSAHVSDWTHVPTTASGDEMRLIDVRLVTPPGTNGSTDWKMESLMEVWQGDEPVSGYPAWIFIVESGRRYVQAERRSPEQSITNLVEIYHAGRRDDGTRVANI
jgi:hypothetical protein